MIALKFLANESVVRSGGQSGSGTSWARTAEWRDAVGNSGRQARAAGETEGPNSFTITAVGRPPPARPDPNKGFRGLFRVEDTLAR